MQRQNICRSEHRNFVIVVLTSGWKPSLLDPYLRATNLYVAWAIIMIKMMMPLLLQWLQSSQSQRKYEICLGLLFSLSHIGVVMLFLSRHGGSSSTMSSIAFTLTKFLLLFHTQLPHLERIEASRIAVQNPRRQDFPYIPHSTSQGCSKIQRRKKFPSIVPISS